VLRLLTDRTRFSLLPALAARFQFLVDEKLGRLRGSVTSAHRLSPQQVDSVRTSLEALTQKKITLEQKIDATVLGGIVAQVGSTVFDGSLRNELAQLHARLSGR
jgi:F-type H+-transporting ATPase subunit delta